jgi:hypothetical protein
MTTHHHPPTPQDPMPLDAEERALAARLARLGPHGEPSPALDARVLAAAHAATAGGARDAGRGHGARGGAEHGWRRVRWPVGVGVAASVALAAGIAWQMRPLPAPVFAPATSTTASVPASPEPSVYSSPTPTEAPKPQALRNLAGPVQREVDDANAGQVEATQASPAAARAAVASKAMAPPLEEPPIVYDAPSPVDVQAPPPAPPAPPAPVAAQPSPMPPPVAAPRTTQDADADAPEADVPPATAASPQVRDAWLARIRELAAGGRSDDARASLAEFRRRYPAFAIPDDLRPLLPPPATPQPQPQPQPQPPPR